MHPKGPKGDGRATDQMTWAREKKTNSSAAPNKRDRNYTSKGSLKTSRFFPANFRAYKSCPGGVTPIEAHSRHPLRWNVAHPETPIHPGLAVLDINAVTDSEGGPGWRQGAVYHGSFFRGFGKNHGSCPIVSKKAFHEGHNYHGEIMWLYIITGSCICTCPNTILSLQVN